MTKILLLGGHGRVSLFMTPKLVARSWNVVSVIRNKDHIPEILEAGKNGPGKVEPLVASIEDVKSVEDAGKIIDGVGGVNWVIWSAGAGGKGGAERTLAIDRDAAIHFIRASIARPSITKFLMVSALSSRRTRAPWWDDDSWNLVDKMNKEILATYYKAKLAADEVLTIEGGKRKGFGWIDLRPGHLTDEPESGRVQIGKTVAKGGVSRADVAEVGARLLEKEGVSGWFDLLGGEKEVGEEVNRVLDAGEDSIEGEDLKVMEENIGKSD
ncbi:NAD(P)-binding Rossmann-fold containing protein [Glarea lozoyensis ATCC 20868]|uniref:NAD(P)-binding Rossmann-fold containing protein n=2 Tax=Glarea lozoyensis TaxID=101852 RepID=S3DU03_GLAL2|nr:NAD(P)-binding Rossmann-fold containing protein [Glarea lozoyensis ATCC 20868]EHL01154.1 putative Uncharacterized sugar epimerase yhfK [Glarea lozoyensis 74030]EPE35426.1 NAD(P)-binding Rossmann-fold containing protein [Glarea lozoyensis ATCC 20868]